MASTAASLPAAVQEASIGAGARYRRLERSTAARYDADIMPDTKSMVQEFAWHERYRVARADEVLTPALLVYPEIIASNIERTVALLDGEADRWRAHVKTAKLGYTLGMMTARGVRNFKCATTLELRVACERGAADVLMAYPVIGANAQRTRELSEEFSGVRISVLVENVAQLRQWRGSRIGIFVDVNPGMNRTGIEQSHAEEIVGLAQAIRAHGLEFRGLHYYDGQYGAVAEPERTKHAHEGYERLLGLVAALEKNGSQVAEVVTAGTPAFPCSISFAGFRGAGFVHRISPGTIIYCDATSQAQLPQEYGYQPAVLVLSRVVSHPRKGMITCDAGHKSVSADAGVPTCVVAGQPGLAPQGPSEEHLPMNVAPGSQAPAVGQLLYLLPRHICPTVNNFDHAVLIRNGAIEAIEEVSARGRERPLARVAKLGAD